MLGFRWLLLMLLVPTFVYADEVKIYNWEEYFSPEVLSQFEKETGHTVTQTYFDNEHLRDDVIASGRGKVYDLILVDSLSLHYMSQKGLMHNFSQEAIPNRIHFSSKAVQACGKTGVPYTWGTMGIAYRTSQFSQPVDSWLDLFQPEQKHVGKITMPLDDVDTVGAALLALKLNPFSDNPEELKQAYQLLSSVKPKMKSFRNTLSYAMEHRESSDLDIALAYSGESYLLNEVTGADDWQYVAPKEGTLLWYECFAAVSSRPLSNATLAFLNFINGPQIAAKNAESIWTATANQSALEYVDQEYLTDSEIYPNQSSLDASFPYQDVSLDGLKARSRIMSTLNRD